MATLEDLNLEEIDKLCALKRMDEDYADAYNGFIKRKQDKARKERE